MLTLIVSQHFLGNVGHIYCKSLDSEGRGREIMMIFHGARKKRCYISIHQQPSSFLHTLTCGLLLFMHGLLPVSIQPLTQWLLCKSTTSRTTQARRIKNNERTFFSDCSFCKSRESTLIGALCSPEISKMTLVLLYDHRIIRKLWKTRIVFGKKRVVATLKL